MISRYSGWLSRILLLGAISLSAHNFTRAQAQETESYPVHPDSKIKDGVPRGEVTQHKFAGSKIFPGTERDYWIYVPKQYSRDKPACLMVFQDGRNYMNRKGGSRVPNVFDNLIHSKEMPVTIGVFVQPGVVPAQNSTAQPRFNRSYEYDGMGDAYARFLIEELLPEVGKSYSISQNPDDRAICGASSGAIAAFTAAWERPDSFRRVYSMIGTFVSLRGGNEYPALIRKTEPKPLRIFLEDGRNDLNIYGGSWWAANQQMFSALKWAGYEVEHKWGEGSHSHKHGASIFPDVMRWLWNDHGQPLKIKYERGSHEAQRFLVENAGWELVSEGHQFTEGPVANGKGEVFFVDVPKSTIHKVGQDGKVSIFAEKTGRTSGLVMGPDQRLYGCAGGTKQILAWDETGKSEIIASGASANDLAIRNDGTIFFTDPRTKTIWRVSAEARKLAAVDMDFPNGNGIVFSPDQTQLYVADSQSKFVYSYVVQKDGVLINKQPFFHLHTPPNHPRSRNDGMCVDKDGWLLVATAMGIQICDQPGRVHVIMPSPNPGTQPSNVCFGGPDMTTLFATCGDKVYKRKTKMTGVHPWQSPVKPPKPRL